MAEASLTYHLQNAKAHGVTREEIAAKGNTLDLGLIKDDSIIDYEDLPDPAESAENAADELEEAVDLLRAVAKELKGLET